MPRPALARGVRLRRDDVRGVFMLVGPERGIVLSDTAAAVVELCDGSRDGAAIAAALAARYEGAPPAIERDVEDLLRALTQRWFLVWREG
jgi:pyrroloquinoline quinone biosynthesis protein D